jgi:hypothetical protein
MWARWLGGPSQGSSPARRSQGRVLPTTKVLNHCLGDMWRPLIGPRVAILFATNKPRVICQLIHTTANQHLPRVVRIYHVSYGPAMCRTTLSRVVQPCHINICMDCIVSTFFLPICRFEQNAISLSSDVRLNPNELCWVRDEETYAPVRFEAIMSTLNFEQNLIPWITNKARGTP